MNYILTVSIAIFLGLQIPIHQSIPTPTTISGEVVDEAGMAMIGATISEIGTKNATISNYDGLFTIQVSSKKAVLEVSYVGYNTVKMKIGDKKYLKIKMVNAPVLDEIVVVRHKSKKESESAKNYMPSSGYVPSPSNSIEGGSPENYKYFSDNQFINTLNEPLSTMSIDVDRASYSNIRRYINSGQMPPKDAVRTEEMINYFNYDYAGPSTKDKDPFVLHPTLTECPWNADHKILHVAMKAQEMSRDQIPPSNFVFLLDVSGSMNHANKLPLLKESFKLLVNQMNENDKVSIVVYAGAAGTIIDGVSGNNQQTILEALDNLSAGGSTAGAAGITKAYQLARKHFIDKGNNRVILATDGDFNVGVSSEGDLVRMIEKERNSGVYLSILGFGIGNYQDNKMQELSNKGNGNHFYIDNIEEAKKSLISEFGGSLYTVAKDVKFQIEFNPQKVAGYRVIGYENRQLENSDFNDDTKDAGELGAGHVVTVLYELIPNGVKSTFLSDIDPLKYSNRTKEMGSESEIATLKCRYKPNDSDQSIKVEIPIGEKLTSFSKTSSSIQWSMVVSEFGMLLRDSEYKSNSNYDSMIKRAQLLTTDSYREECLTLMRKAKTLSESKVGEE